MLDQRPRGRQRKSPTRADADDPIVGLDDISCARYNKRVLEVRHGKQGFEAAQDAVCAPILGQFDRSTGQIPSILLEFCLKLGKERKGIRGSSCKAGEDLIMMDATDFAGPVLEHHIVKADLSIPGHGHFPTMANGNHCRRMNHAPLRARARGGASRKTASRWLVLTWVYCCV